jgi:hypothetical protein
MGSYTSKLTIPTIKSVKSLQSLQEYPVCTLGQIFEAYAYWVNSEYSRKGALFPNEFEEVFGQLFPDPILHFQKLQESTIGAVVTVDAFYVLILLSDASMENKIKAIYEINNKDVKILMRLDALQLMIFRILTSLKLVFTINIPSREDVYQFLEYSLRQFLERTHLSTDAHNEDSVKAYTTSSIQSTCLTFEEIWQWAQDVHQVSSFLEAINEICLTITDSIDRTHKGKQWVLRNSFFSSNSFSLNTTNNNLRATLRLSSFSNAGRMSQTNDLLFNILQEVNNKMNKLENNFFNHFLMEQRHPLWRYTINNMVDNEKWFTSIPVVYTDQKVFTGLEHMILSQQKSLLVLHNKHLNHYQQQSPHNQQHHGHHLHQNHGSQAHIGSKVGSSHDHHQHHHGSRANLTSNTSLHNHSSTSVGQTAAAGTHHHQGYGGHPASHQSSSSHSQFVPQPPAGTAAPAHRGLHRLSTIGISSVGGGNSVGGGGGAGTSFHPLGGKLELFGIMDYGSILSWMIDSAPSIVLKELKKQQKFIRSKRLSFEFSLKQEFMSQDSSLDSYDGGDVEAGEGGGGGGDVLDISPTNRQGLELMMDFDHHGDGGGGGGSDEEDTYYDQGFHEVDEDHDSNLLHHVIEEGNENAESPAFKPRTSKVILSSRKSTMKGGKVPAGRPSSIITDASQGNLRQGSRASLLPVHSKQQLHQSSTASLNAGGYSQRNRSIQMTSSTLKNNKWQNMGDLVANSNIEKIFYTKNFASFHQKCDVNNILTNDQYLYNLILLAAKGHRHLPVSVEANNFYKIFHIISSQEIADFLFENCQDIFSNLNQPTGLPDNNNNNQAYSQSRQSQRSTSPLERRSASPTHNRPQTNSGSSRPQTNSSSSGNNSNKNKMIDRPVVWTGLMRKPSVVSTLMTPKEPKEYQNSLLAFRNKLASKSTDEHREANNTSSVPQQSQQQQTKTKIRYNLGSIFYQLLQSNLDSIVVTNEKNKVVSVVSIHVIQDFWWAWKKRNLFETYPNKPSLEDLIKEYEQGTYQLYEDDENEHTTSCGANVGPTTTGIINAGSMMHSGSSSLLNNNPMLKRLTTNNTSTPQAHHPSVPSTTPHSSSYQRHSSTASTTGFTAPPVLPSPAVGSKFSFSNYNANETTNATTPYPFQQNVNSAIANNVNISKYNFTFFSVLMNYIDQCQDLLNITVLDLEECLKDPEEERELLLKLQKEQERLLSRQKSPKGSKKSPNKFDEAAQNANKDQPTTTVGTTSHPTAPSAMSPIPTTTAPVIPPSSPEQGSPEKGESKDRPVTASKSPVKGGKKGKNTKKYGGFGTLAAYQDHLQREKDKEESKKRVRETKNVLLMYILFTFSFTV